MKYLTINKEFPIRIEDIARKLLIEKRNIEDRIAKENSGILRHEISDEYQIYCDYGYRKALKDVVKLLRNQPIFYKSEEEAFENYFRGNNLIEEKSSSK